MPTPTETLYAALHRPGFTFIGPADIKAADLWLSAAAQAMDPSTPTADALRYLIAGREAYGADVQRLRALAALLPALEPLVSNFDAECALDDAREMVGR